MSTIDHYLSNGIIIRISVKHACGCIHNYNTSKWKADDFLELFGDSQTEFCGECPTEEEEVDYDHI